MKIKSCSKIVPAIKLLVPLICALALSACATQSNPEMRSAEAEPAAGNAASAPVRGSDKVAKLPLAYFANRGEAANLNSLASTVDRRSVMAIYTADSAQKMMPVIGMPTGALLSEVKIAKPALEVPALLREVNGIIYLLDRGNSTLHMYSHYSGLVHLRSIKLEGLTNPSYFEILPPETEEALNQVWFADEVDGTYKLKTLTMNLLGTSRDVRKTEVEVLLGKLVELPLPAGADPSHAPRFRFDSLAKTIWFASGEKVMVLDRAGKVASTLDLPGEHIVGLDARICRRGPETGYWIVARNTKAGLSRFDVVDRSNQKPLGSFEIESSAELTDMMSSQTPSALFESGGVFFTQKNGIGAVSWAEVANALNLRKNCF